MEQLPFSYYDPKHEGKLSWFCSKDEDEEKVVSVFVCAWENDKKVDYITEDQAYIIRQELIANGWLKTPPPQINLIFEDKDIKK